MFKLESYITPLLMGYIDKYVELKPEDFKLSLWGGDIILNKLNLRVDSIEQTLKLPVVIKSGFVHELRIHVPWTRLYSEPIVITVNTIECILKVNQNLDSSDIKSPLNSESSFDNVKQLEQIEDQNFPPGYFEGMARKMLRNITLVVNNLIVKFLDDDIVLSLNVKSAECYSVNNSWNRAIKDLSASDLSLSRIIEVQDLTLCLDECSESGKILTYQDPVLYHCSLTCRILMIYESCQAIIPSRIIVNILNEQLDIFLTDIQLPLVLRLMNLFVKISHESPKNTNLEQTITQSTGNLSETRSDVIEPTDWISWAWSQMTFNSEYDDTQTPSPIEKQVFTCSFVLGIYLKKTILHLSANINASKNSKKLSLIRCAVCHVLGAALEMNISDQEFCINFGVSGIEVCSIKEDSSETVLFKNESFERKFDESSYLKCTLFNTVDLCTTDEQNAWITSLAQDDRFSNFEFVKFKYFINLNKHEETLTQNQAESDYDSDEVYIVEVSFGACEISVCQELASSIHHIMACVAKSSFGYSTDCEASDTTNCEASGASSVAFPSSNEFNYGERKTLFKYSIVFNRLSVCVFPLDVLRNTSLKDSTCRAATNDGDPCLTLVIDQLKLDAYHPSPGKLTPDEELPALDISSKVLQNCYFKMMINGKLQIKLQFVDKVSTKVSYVIIEPFDVEIQLKYLLFKHLWRDILQLQEELIFKVGAIHANMSKSQLLIVVNVISSWSNVLHSTIYRQHDRRDLSLLLEDAFMMCKKDRSGYDKPTLKFCLGESSIQLMKTEVIVALTCSISTMTLCLMRTSVQSVIVCNDGYYNHCVNTLKGLPLKLGIENGKEFVTPVLCAPMNPDSQFFDTHTPEVLSNRDHYFVRVLLQLPRDVQAIQAPVAVHINISGIVCQFDSVVREWLSYKSQNITTTSSSKLPLENVYDKASSIATTETLPGSSLMLQNAHKTKTSDSVISTTNSLFSKSKSITVPSNKKVDLCRETTLIQKLLNLYPFVKTADVSVNFAGCSMYINSDSRCAENSNEQVKILMQKLCQSDHLQNTFGITIPNISILSNRGQVCSQFSIPIKSTDQALAKEKFPWQIKFGKGSIFIVDNSKKWQYIISEISIDGTLTASYGYEVGSLNKSRLNWKSSLTTNAIEVSISDSQFSLIHKLVSIQLDCSKIFVEDVLSVFPKPDLTEDMDIISEESQNISHFHDQNEINNVQISSDKVLKNEERELCQASDVDPPSHSLLLELTIPEITFVLYTKGTDEIKNELKVCTLIESIKIIFDMNILHSNLRLSVNDVSVKYFTKELQKLYCSSLYGVLLSRYDGSARNINVQNAKGQHFPNKRITEIISRVSELSSTNNSLITVMLSFSKSETVRNIYKDTRYKCEEDLDSLTVYNTCKTEIQINCQPLDIIYCDEVIESLVAFFSVLYDSHMQSEASSLANDTMLHSRSVTVTDFPFVQLNLMKFRVFYLRSIPALDFVDLYTFVLQLSSFTISSHVTSSSGYKKTKNKPIAESLTVSPCAEDEMNESRLIEMKVVDVSVCSGKWRELPGADSCKKDVSSLLEISCSSSEKSVILEPLLNNCDIDITLDLSDSFDQITNSAALAHVSLEINAVSDVNITVNSEQVGHVVTLLNNGVFNTSTKGIQSAGLNKSSGQKFDASKHEIQKLECNKYKDVTLDEQLRTFVLITTRKVSATLYSVSNCGTPDLVIKEILPICYICLCQPHMIVDIDPESQKNRLQISLHDCFVKGFRNQHPKRVNVSSIPEVIDFQITWFETKLGAINKKTGLHSNFLTIVIDKTARNENGYCVDVSIERPSMFNYNENQVKCISSFLSEIDKIVYNTVSTTSFNQDSCNTFNSPIAYICDARFSLIHFSILYTEEDSNSINTVLLLGSSSIKATGNLALNSKYVVMQLSSAVCFKDVTLKVNIDNKFRRILNPCCLDLLIKFAQISSENVNKLPKVSVKLASDYLNINICSTLVQTFLNKPDKNKQSYEVNLQKQPIKDGWYSRYISNESVQTIQYKDDLKSGYLTYTCENKPIDQINVGELNFSRDVKTSSAAMTWRYPESRIVNRIFALPIPFDYSGCENTESSRIHRRLPCILQCTLPDENVFVDCRKFWISENVPCEIQISVPTDFPSQIMSSELWRIKLLYNELEDNASGYPVVSPMALAMTVCIDSIYSSKYISPCNIVLKVNCLQIRLLSDLPTISTMDHYGTTYNVAPIQRSHETAVVSLTDIYTYASSSSYKQLSGTVRARTQFKMDILNYRNLTLLPLLENSRLECTLNKSLQHSKHNTLCDVKLDKLAISIGQSSLWTLLHFLQDWKCTIDRPSVKLTSRFHYIIFNDTCTNFCIGQVNTDEYITVNSRHAVQYFWKSNKLPQLLQIKSEGNISTSILGININKDGMSTVSIPYENDKRLMFIITVNSVGEMQKKIVISGQVSVVNLLAETIEACVDCIADDTSSCCIIPSNTSSACFCLDYSVSRFNIKLRIAESSALWSQEISLTEREIQKLIFLPTSSVTEKYYVWYQVVNCSFNDINQFMIVISPLFFARSLLSFPLQLDISSNSSKFCRQHTVDGKGKTTQMPLLDGGSSTYQVNLRFSEGVSSKSPAILISTGTLKQVELTSLKEQSMLVLSENLLSQDRGSQWPFNSRDDVDCLQLKDDSLADDDLRLLICCKDDCSKFDQLPFSNIGQDINVNINIEQRWPNFNTLLFEIVPDFTIVNKISFDIILLMKDKTKLTIKAGENVSYDKITDEFSIGVIIGTKVHESNYISKSEDDDAKFRYHSESDNVLYREGNLCINIPIVFNGIIVQLCCLTLQSTVYHKMRVITIRESFSLINVCDNDFDIQCLSVPDDIVSTKKVFIPDNFSSQLVATSSGIESTRQPLLLWNLVSSEPFSALKFPKFHCRQYVRFRLRRKSCETGNEASECHSDEEWSLPVKFKHSNSGKRLSVLFPAMPGSKNSAYSLIIQPDSSIWYLTFTVNKQPEVHIHNNCMDRLYFGQASSDSNRFSIPSVIEEMDSILNLPYILPFSSCYYNFPSHFDRFPEILENFDMHKIRIGVRLEETSILWSRKINVHTDSDMFVSIPNYSDVRVSVKKLASTIYVNIEPINRAVVSQTHFYNRFTGHVAVEGLTRKLDTEHRLQKITSGHKLSKEEPLNETFSLHAICFLISVSLLDEGIHNPEFLSEFVSVNSDNLTVSLYTSQAHAFDCDILTHNFILSCSDLQIDNKEFENGNFDFPVILIKRIAAKEDHVVNNDEELSFQEIISINHSSSFLRVTGEIAYVPHQIASTMHKFTLSVKPLTLQLEDVFIRRVLAFITSSLNFPSNSSTFLNDSRHFPRRLKPILDDLSEPVSFEYLCIDSVNVLVSFRASMRLFVSTTDTPLVLTKFEKRQTCTTLHVLGKALAFHYASDIAIRAGILVGSLEILGNPTRFVQLLGEGISDMFLLPYNSFTSGPSAFISGVSSGIKSVTKHFYQGTLLSVNNFTTSISRNAERLSLDNDHIHRNELLRRQVPSGITEGVKNGLTGFGMSILGAVAGIVDHPLQAFATIDHKDNTEFVRNVISGFGKGLVGIVTKPIGGTAELVSQTTRGILHSVDTNSTVSQRNVCCRKAIATLYSGLAKYSELILTDSTEVIMKTDLALIWCVDCKSQSANMPPCCSIGMTADKLYVFNSENDEVVLKFNNADINCELIEGDIFCLTPRNIDSLDGSPTPGHDERVVEFIRDVNLINNNYDCYSTSASETGPALDRCQLDNSMYIFKISGSYQSDFLSTILSLLNDV